jgi:hypothetical protein
MPFKTKHIPTETSRAKVALLSAFSIDQDAIALEIGITRKTLSVHYKRELEHGLSKAVATVANKLYTKAISADRDALTAMIFFLKVRGGWREQIALTNADGSNLVDLSQATDEQLDQLERIYASIARKAKTILSAERGSERGIDPHLRGTRKAANAR